jgi:putative ABC transport system ATP-binding protein
MEYMAKEAKASCREPPAQERLMLTLHNVTVIFHADTPNEVTALDHVSLNAEAGEFITVIGANGAGKSTLFNVIAGTVPIDRGQIILDHDDVTDWPEYRRSLNVGRVFQNPATGTCSGLSIRENLSLATLRGRKLGFAAGVKKVNQQWFSDLARSVNLGLETRLDTDVELLSGGQRQAITLIMATMMRPKLLLLDEHTAALDPNASAQVLELTVKLAAEYRLTVIMVTHSMQQAVAVGKRVVMMNRGRILADIAGEERANLHYRDLIERFRVLQTGSDLTDRAVLS